MNKKSINVIIEPELFKNFSILCLENDKSKQDLIIEWIVNYVTNGGK